MKTMVASTEVRTDNTTACGYGRSDARAISLPFALSVDDIHATQQQLYVLGTTEPKGYSTEHKHNVILYGPAVAGRFSQANVLHGNGLANEDGTGQLLHRPRRVLACDSQHFLLVAERQPANLSTLNSHAANEDPQLALYQRLGDHQAEFLHFLARPEAMSDEMAECDISPASVQVRGTIAVACVRWKDHENFGIIYEGQRGKNYYLRGGQTAEVVAWRWSTGEVGARIPLEHAQIEMPTVILADETHLVIHVQGEVFEETATYDPSNGGKRISHLVERARGTDRAHDACAVKAGLFEIKSLPAEAGPAFEGILHINGTFIGSDEIPLLPENAKATVTNEHLHQPVSPMAKIALLPNADLSILKALDKLHAEPVLVCGHKGVWRVSPGPPTSLQRTSWQARQTDRYFLIDMRPSYGDSTDIYRVRSSRVLRAQTQVEPEDSGYSSPTSSGHIHKDALVKGWTIVRLVELTSIALLDALHKGTLHWNGEHVIVPSTVSANGTQTLEWLSLC